MNAEQLLRLVEDFGDVEAAKRLWGLAKRLGDAGLKQRAATCLWERGAWRVDGGYASGAGYVDEYCDDMGFSEGFVRGQRALLGVRHWAVVVDGSGGYETGVVGAVLGLWMLRVGLMVEGVRRGGGEGDVREDVAAAEGVRSERRGLGWRGLRSGGEGMRRCGRRMCGRCWMGFGPSGMGKKGLGCGYKICLWGRTG